MNKSSLLLSALLAATLGTTTATAGELYGPEQFQDPQGTLTRAAVKQTVLRDRATGALNHNDFDVPGVPTVGFAKSRAQVKGEVLAARATGGLEHDDVDLPAVAKGSYRTRQEVRSEAIAASRAPINAPGKNTIDY